MASGGSDPVTRVGPCNGYKCHCKAYVQAKADRTWPVCECRHVQQTHANPEAEVKDGQAAGGGETGGDGDAGEGGRVDGDQAA